MAKRERARKESESLERLSHRPSQHRRIKQSLPKFQMLPSAPGERRRVVTTPSSTSRSNLSTNRSMLSNRCPAVDGVLMCPASPIDETRPWPAALSLIHPASSTPAAPGRSGLPSNRTAATASNRSYVAPSSRSLLASSRTLYEQRSLLTSVAERPAEPHHGLLAAGSFSGTYPRHISANMYPYASKLMRDAELALNPPRSTEVDPRDDPDYYTIDSDTLAMDATTLRRTAVELGVRCAISYPLPPSTTICHRRLPSPTTSLCACI